jgi:hypothetical protein
MRSIHRFLPALLVLGTLTGCGVHTPATTVGAVKAATKSQAKVFDRFEAAVSTDATSGTAILEITAKSLMSQFKDDDVTVFVPMGKGAPEGGQQNLFCSKVFLGQDGHLYLSEQPKPGARPRYYEVGTYDAFRQPGDPVRFKFADGMKLEARNKSIVPVGAGPFLALVVQERPSPTAHAPNLVR